MGLYGQFSFQTHRQLKRRLVTVSLLVQSETGSFRLARLPDHLKSNVIAPEFNHV